MDPLAGAGGSSGAARRGSGRRPGRSGPGLGSGERRSRRGTAAVADPVGGAVSAFLAAFVTLAHLLDDQGFQSLRIWLNGTLAGRSQEVFLWGLPWFAGGLLLAFAIRGQVTALAMGEEVATGLGVDAGRIRILALGAVVALTAASVALVGPLGFVGLVIPHAARLLTGADYRRIIPVSAGLGAIYLLAVDIVARLALAPVEIATGLVTALVGGPVFIWLVRVRL
ncbi:ABC-type Fe3+-siderophore transport system, permease component [Rubellimicrobium thermophilum DSM 16684]|uniref:ABC-type Fe3+-siderophore transport system, permease component n=1 Tax=Rubellimicrobium thermophilum DSM 16684 TaxID=1123069 RepID=S9QT19_9RHOB|nr:ABC-type Fe3+-siderophore transport system, permease component [Rubellimicrobium thermophilum DSM 16684]